VRALCIYYSKRKNGLFIYITVRGKCGLCIIIRGMGSLFIYIILRGKNASLHIQYKGKDGLFIYYSKWEVRPNYIYNSRGERRPLYIYYSDENVRHLYMYIYYTKGRRPLYIFYSKGEGGLYIYIYIYIYIMVRGK
jgi:hypothetical protein